MVDDPDEHTRDLAAAIESPTGWFEELYTQAQQGDAIVPWDRGTPHDLLVSRVPDRGTLLVIAAARDADTTPEGPPWPLTRDEILAFATDGLEPHNVVREENRWRAEFPNG